MKRIKRQPVLGSLINKYVRHECGEEFDVALRWCAAGMVEAGTQFRRVNGHLHLRALRTALDGMSQPKTSKPTSTITPAMPPDDHRIVRAEVRCGDVQDRAVRAPAGRDERVPLCRGGLRRAEQHEGHCCIEARGVLATAQSSEVGSVIPVGTMTNRAPSPAAGLLGGQMRPARVDRSLNATVPPRRGNDRDKRLQVR